jgi:hypothetical protein
MKNLSNYSRRELEDRYAKRAFDNEDIPYFDHLEYEQYFDFLELGELPPEINTLKKEDEYYKLLEMEVDDWEAIVKTDKFGIDDNVNIQVGMPEWHIEKDTVEKMIERVHDLKSYAKNIEAWEDKKRNFTRVTLNELSKYTGKSRKQILTEYESEIFVNNGPVEAPNLYVESSLCERDTYFSNELGRTCYIFKFYQEQFEAGKPTREKIEEDKRREQYREEWVESIEEDRTIFNGNEKLVDMTGLPYGIVSYVNALLKEEESNLEINY